jgi:hypothetical protein
MSSPAVYPYVHLIPALGPVGWMPLLPITLDLNGTKVSSLALLDSGSTINLMPYQLGVQLGGDWNQFKGSLPMGGPLAGYPAKPLFVDATIASFPPVQLSFAWTQAPHTRLLLGQTNFFELFDVCFFRSRNEFQIQPATP